MSCQTLLPSRYPYSLTQLLWNNAWSKHECLGPGRNAWIRQRTNVVKLTPTTVVGKLDVAREEIVPELGATVYNIDKAQIQALPHGETRHLIRCC